MSVILRYFDAQGRAQALRHALAEATLPFEDVRVAMATWPAHREDAGFGGWFASLPTLTWDGDTIGETLVIATYLAGRLGHYDGLDAGSIAQLEAVVSCAYQDVTRRLADVLWAPVLYPGADLTAATTRFVGASVEKLGRISTLLPRDTGWLGGDRPTLADFFVGEAFEATRYVLGPAHEARLRARLPRLATLAEQLRERPAITAAWATRPPNLTASPAEPAAIDRVQGYDFSSFGL